VREVDYLTFQRPAKHEDALIYFGDEAGIRSDHPSGTTWAPQGQSRVMRRTEAAFR